MRAAFLLATALTLAPVPAMAARQAVWASDPGAVAVTVYRDPSRGENQEINRDWPQGFALISETRTVTLPPGESTIRFDGVSEGMIAVSAIVTGLPGGTIEKNRNADLLSPASLVDGTLGNRVTITRTDPATGAERSEQAIVRTRADGGLVLQTGAGYEAVRCSGLPERLSFDSVPDGLSARPVYSIDTSDANGGTYQIVLTYLSWGFDWQAHYVANFEGTQRGGDELLGVRSWLTLVNDNGQSFENADLNVVAGELSVVSDYQGLADPPDARALSLACYPIGSTAAGSPIPYFDVPPPAPPPAPMMVGMAAPMAAMQRSAMMEADMLKSDVAMQAEEESLGDLKLYRVPEQVTVAAKSMKQVAFLDKDAVKGKLFYRADCSVWGGTDDAEAALIVLETVNDEKHGLGAALPMGGVTLFENGLLVGEEWLRDHAEGQDVEIELAESTQVFSTCAKAADVEPYVTGYPWVPMRATFTNANPAPVRVKLRLGPSGEWRVREGLRGLSVEDGQLVMERTIPANGSENISWSIRYFAGEGA